MAGMVKSWVSGIVMVVLVFGLTAGTRADFSDNFEPYDADTNIIGQGDWVDWGGGTAGAGDGGWVRTTPAIGQKSLEIGGETSPDYADACWEFSGLTAWTPTFSTMTYIPTSSDTKQSDINIMSVFANPGYSWMQTIVFDLAGGVVKHDAATANIVRDTWIEFKAEVEIDDQELRTYYNGVLLKADTWGGATKEFAAINLWCPSDAPPIYYDDMSVTPEPATLVLIVMGGLGLAARRRKQS